MSGDNSPEAGFYMAATAPPLLESMKQAYQTVAVAIATASESTGRAKPQHHIFRDSLSVVSYDPQNHPVEFRERNFSPLYRPKGKETMGLSGFL